MKILHLVALIFSFSLFSACGDSEESMPPPAEKSSHVWQSQTDTLKTAQDAAADMNQALQMREEQIKKVE